MTEYQRRIVETLVRAKYAGTEEQRAQFFKTAEEWSERAREAEEPGCDDENLGEAALWRGIADPRIPKEASKCAFDPELK